MTAELDKYLEDRKDHLKNYVVMGKDWELVDTHAGEQYSDEDLLMLVSLVPLLSGWGLICELMKRYKKLTTN